MTILESLRQEIDAIDRSILENAAKRLKLVDQISAFKASGQIPVRDFGREKQCLDMAKKNAKSLGLSSDFAEKMIEQLIRESLKHQEQNRVSSQSKNKGKTALIIGGSGKMGSWFGRFLSSQGFYVEVEDTHPSPDGFLKAGLGSYDMTIVATPMSISGDILKRLATRKISGVVFDIASLKEPVREGLEALLAAGVQVCSVHPMFGASTELLSGKHLIIGDLGCPEANNTVKALFEPTMAQVVMMSLSEHDKVVGFLLGLSHALNIAFFTALAQSGESAPRLKELSSTTFDAQVEVARRVASENPHLYYEIQALNPYGDTPLKLLSESLEKIRNLVKKHDESGFVQIMEQGNRYFL